MCVCSFAFSSITRFFRTFCLSGSDPSGSQRRQSSHEELSLEGVERHLQALLLVLHFPQGFGNDPRADQGKRRPLSRSPLRPRLRLTPPSTRVAVSLDFKVEVQEAVAVHLSFERNGSNPTHSAVLCPRSLWSYKSTFSDRSPASRRQ